MNECVLCYTFAHISHISHTSVCCARGLHSRLSFDTHTHACGIRDSLWAGRHRRTTDTKSVDTRQSNRHAAVQQHRNENERDCVQCVCVGRRNRFAGWLLGRLECENNRRRSAGDYPQQIRSISARLRGRSALCRKPIRHNTRLLRRLRDMIEDVVMLYIASFE